MKIELIPGQIVEFGPIEPDETIHVGVSEFYEFRLYSDMTLRDVLDEIDENPDLYEELHPQDICDEIGCEDDYQTLLEQPMSAMSRLFLQTFLSKVNSLIQSNYENNVINGEETLHGVIIFDDLQEGINRVESLKQLEDYSGRIMCNILAEKGWENYPEDIFYIYKVVTYN